MASNLGSATLDFGSHPGSNEANVTISGQTAISITSSVEAFVMANDSTVLHTANDHRYFNLFAKLTCGTPTAGTGFTVYATSLEKLSGTFNVRWVWSD